MTLPDISDKNAHSLLGNLHMTHMHWPLVSILNTHRRQTLFAQITASR